MNLYRWIIVFGLGPRALRNVWHVFIWLGMVLVVLYTVAANACSDTALPSAAAASDASTIASMTARLVPSALEYGPPPPPAPVPLCFQSDVKTLCCPSACATKASPKWERANEVLRACMKGIGCSDSESKGATVGMKCNCSKGKP